MSGRAGFETDGASVPHTGVPTSKQFHTQAGFTSICVRHTKSWIHEITTQIGTMGGSSGARRHAKQSNKKKGLPKEAKVNMKTHETSKKKKGETSDQKH